MTAIGNACNGNICIFVARLRHTQAQASKFIDSRGSQSVGMVFAPFLDALAAMNRIAAGNISIAKYDQKRQPICFMLLRSLRCQ